MVFRLMDKNYGQLASKPTRATQPKSNRSTLNSALDNSAKIHKTAQSTDSEWKRNSDVKNMPKMKGNNSNLDIVNMNT